MSQNPPRFFIDRLRDEPIASTVRGSLPVLSFGDPFSSVIATVGINPSRREYPSAKGVELDGIERRFETFESLGVTSRSEIIDALAITAIDRMCNYFDAGRPVYTWFNGLSRVVEGLGLSFRDRSAVHLDLVQEATDPTWSQLKQRDPSQAEAVLDRDLEFLRMQIHTLNFRAIVCTSALVWKCVKRILDIRVTATGELARVKWTVGVAEQARGQIGVVGWNIPLARPTGLKAEGEGELGAVLASELTRAQINVA